MTLTPKQESFARSYVETGNASEAYRWYVYHLVDPRDNSVFYVGKGTGNRIKAHVRDALNGKFANSQKESRILAILWSGERVLELIVSRHETSKAALLAEKKEIARIGMENLTNLAKGGEPIELKALRRAEAWTKDMEHKLRFLSGRRLNQAVGLMHEMRQNISVCKAVLGYE